MRTEFWSEKFTEREHLGMGKVL